MGQHEYRDTARDAKKLAQHVKPGDYLYVIHDVADRFVTGRGPHGYEDAQLYSTWIVTNDRTFDFRAELRVRPASAGPGKGVTSLRSLLGKNGAIYTAPPMGMRDIAIDPADKRNAAGHAKAATAALETGAAKSGAKRGWW